MGLFSIFLTGVGLSMDACAVSFAKGVSLKSNVKLYAFVLAVFFGGFQMLMPLLGFWAGTYFERYITAFDHWIAFILLLLIGINMLRESKESDKEVPESMEKTSHISFKEILLMAIATSIDALAVGISFAFLGVNIWTAVLIIGATTFIISLAAVFCGNKIGGKLGKYAGILGGIILILIGVKILIEHLFF